MKPKKAITITISLLTGMVLYFSMFHLPTVSAESEITIDVLPGEVLFDVDNMKPGDWAPRTVVIQNNGLMEFNYTTTLKPNGKSMKLFNELLLEIKDSNGELYNGKLADFKELDPSNLKSSSEEEIHYTVRFPSHLGNDFQGLDAKFTLIFSAKGEDNAKDEKALSSTIAGNDGPGGSSGTSSGSVLPTTAAGMFNFILIGTLLLAGGGLLVLYNRKRMKTKEE